MHSYHKSLTIIVNINFPHNFLNQIRHFQNFNFAEMQIFINFVIYYID